MMYIGVQDIKPCVVSIVYIMPSTFNITNEYEKEGWHFYLALKKNLNVIYINCKDIWSSLPMGRSIY